MNPQDPNSRSRLAAKKLALLEQRLRGDSPGTARRGAILRREPGNLAPLSFAQQRLWFLDQLMPGSAFYNIYNIVRLKQSLSINVLERCLREMVRRHEVFRTRFAVGDGMPVQVIAPGANEALRVVDLRTLTFGARRVEAQRLATEEARRPFDLASGPLMRAVLLQMDDSEQLLLISMHHIVTDGWSMGIFFRELGALYEAFVLGRPSPLPELPIQYADFAVWQREQIKGELKERVLSYWREQLADAPVLALLTDRPRAAVQSFRGAFEALTFLSVLNEGLKELSRREGVTLFMTTLAAFKALLYRYSGQEDIVVGSPIAGRNRTELEALIGFFVNTLVLRTRFDGRLSFRELLRRVQKVALEAYAHQDLPFEMLVEELQPARDLSRNPMFQVMFQLVTAAGGQPEADATGLPLEVTVETAKFDLTVTLSDTGGSLTGSLEYNTDLFDTATIVRLIGHYRMLLEGIVANPDTPLDELPLLSTEERQRLAAWNATESAYPNTRGVHRLFEERAAASPDAAAVCLVDGETLSYGELNTHANRLARVLRQEGVAPEEPVGICLERSLQMIVATLAVLKAGGSYLPLDPTYPKRRLATMLGDAGARLLLSRSALRELLPEDGLRVIFLDRDWPEIERASGADLDGADDGERLAYVMYTSGSTGVPKGIGVPHRAIARLVLNSDYLSIRPGDRVAHASNCSFDAATFEIWGALLNGAQLVVVPKEVTISCQGYVDFIQQQHFHVLFVTTALFNQVVQHAPWAFHPVRDLLFGGEAADPHWVREVLEHGPPERLLLMYGPTESTTYATWQLVQSVPQGVATVPIGRPVANTLVYVLDAQHWKVPVGVPGELTIGGDGLARGYLGQPGLTAEKFIPDPFAATPGARAYRTGDRARYRDDGTIEFLGRSDHQVKLRGFRIELGEIQAALEEHPGVGVAAVVLREAPTGDRRLVAYLVPRGGAAPSADELRSFLRECLPEYMVPAAFVALEALPLNPNGKLEQSALPPPSDGDAGAAAGFVAPQTPNERLIAEIWREVLGREQVGIHDNFFDLGGHSLSMARVHNWLRERIPHEVSMIDLFQYPTISSLARRLDSLEVPAAPMAEENGRRQQVQERVARQKQALQKRASQRDRRIR